MATLKEDHSYLYKRVRLKMIMFFLLGITLTFLPKQIGATQRNSAILTNFPIEVFGVIYLVIAAGIMIGLFKPDQTYSFARRILTVGVIYNIFWVLLFMLLLINNPSQGTGWGLFMYGYFTYNTWLVRGDPGWNAIAIVKRITDDDNSRNI